MTDQGEGSVEPIWVGQIDTSSDEWIVVVGATGVFRARAADVSSDSVGGEECDQFRGPLIKPTSMRSFASVRRSCSR